MTYCLIGKTLSHSYSKVLHTSYGLDYRLEEVAPEDLAQWVQHNAYEGYNVTIPYKEAVMPLLDELSPAAKRLGAVNTVCKRHGRTVGYNTDYDGFVGALRYYGLSAEGKTALVLGTGGAAKVVQAALTDLGATKVLMVSRRGPIDYQNCYEVEADIVVNATPVGTYPHGDEAPVDVTRFGHLEWVYDLVYNPCRTALIQSAQDKGVTAKNGLAMLVIQALAARRIWTGAAYDEGDVRQCLDRLRLATVNIALVGMPSAGKSTVGQALAAVTQMPYWDTDDMVTKREGRTPAAIIRQDGEEAFRAIESQVVQEAAAKRGIVLATGGGVVLSEANRSILRQTAMVVYLQRDLSRLTDQDRPTLAAQGAAQMAAKRHPLYLDAADVVVDNNGTVEDAVQQILYAYENFGH